MSTSPDECGIAPTMARTNVDLPEPLPPMSATTWPASTAAPTPCRISVPSRDTRTSRASSSVSVTAEPVSQGVQVAPHDAQVVLPVAHGLERAEDCDRHSRVGGDGLDDARGGRGLREHRGRAGVLDE